MAQNVAQQLEKSPVSSGYEAGNAKRYESGRARNQVSGREIGRRGDARAEMCHEGGVPLHAIRADVDYATAEARTTYRIIGVKVWIFKGEVIGDREKPFRTSKASVKIMLQPKEQNLGKCKKAGIGFAQRGSSVSLGICTKATGEGE